MGDSTSVISSSYYRSAFDDDEKDDTEAGQLGEENLHTREFRVLFSQFHEEDLLRRTSYTLYFLDQPIDFSCAIATDNSPVGYKLFPGRLYVSTKHVCFYAAAFGSVKQVRLVAHNFLLKKHLGSNPSYSHSFCGAAQR